MTFEHLPSSAFGLRPAVKLLLWTLRGEMGVLQTLGLAGLLWLAFLAAFVAFILLLYWPVERFKRYLRWCPACQLAGRGRYCENCGERLEKRKDLRPRCFHCGALFEKEVPKFCRDCGFSQGPRVGEKAGPKAS